MRGRFLLGLALLACACTTTAQPDAAAPLEPPTWPSLERFASDAELADYLRAVRQVVHEQRQRRMAGADREEAIVVTGSRLVGEDFEAMAPITTVGAEQLELSATLTSDSLLSELPQAMPASITNVQTQGVDEGGIVKMVGRFLIILQDGRLFVVDAWPNGEPGLALAGRTEVYRSADADTWYDEMLISGNRILVTGYSYAEDASEIAVFTIDDTGALTRETAFYISSDDYYDTENYATRLVNGNLVIYTPLNLRHADLEGPLRWPLVRRWLRDEDRRAVTTPGVTLFDAHDIYKPLQPTLSPVVHSVSVCPLGDLRSGDELECQTTAFVGPTERAFFVSTTDIFLWVTPSPWADEDYLRPCDESDDHDPDRYAAPATLYRVPLSGAAPQALSARGRPDSQMAMDATDTEFRALLAWNTSRCSDDDAIELRYFRAPLRTLSSRPNAAPAYRYTRVPPLEMGEYEVRFSATHLAYGGRDDYAAYAPDDDETRQDADLFLVPVTRPSATIHLTASHEILRIERARDRFVVTGYRDSRGLSVSVVELGPRPRLTDTQVLEGRFESENRSHAFNSIVGADGAGVMGLPTVTRIKESGRWVWRSEASDISFLTLDANGHLDGAGELRVSENAVDPSYQCEVSCIDWYGNTRALFIGRRIIGLSGTELIEGALENGRVAERRRLNLSAPPPRS